MATVDELLIKQKDRLEKMSADVPSSQHVVARKKIQRTGPTRPWQENLPQYQTTTTASPTPPMKSSNTENSSVVLLQGQNVTPLPAQADSATTSKTGSKEVANGEQTGSRWAAKEVANGEQTGSKEVAEVQNNCAPLPDPKPKRVAQRVAQRVANSKQTGSKEVAKALFEALVGKERALLLFIIEDCQINGDLKTGPLTLERISEVLGCSSNRAKNVLHRLTEKSFLCRTEAKTGRGGWTRFGVSKELFQKILLSETGSKALANGYQTGSKQVAKRVAQQVADPSSSSSLRDLNQNLKTTTTSEPELFECDATQLAPEWQPIECAPLAGIGFTQTHLVQIIRQGKLTPAEVQDSIHFFAFDLARNGKAKGINGNPLNYFMGIVRKGAPYAPPENYESPETEARRKYLDGKRRLEEQKLAEEHELRNLTFTEWRRGLTEPLTRSLVPDAVKDLPRAREASLRDHFDNQVWPELEAARLGGNESERQQIRAAITQSLGDISK